MKKNGYPCAIMITQLFSISTLSKGSIDVSDDDLPLVEVKLYQGKYVLEPHATYVAYSKPIPVSIDVRTISRLNPQLPQHGLSCTLFEEDLGRHIAEEGHEERLIRIGCGLHNNLDRPVTLLPNAILCRVGIIS